MGSYLFKLLLVLNLLIIPGSCYSQEDVPAEEVVNITPGIPTVTPDDQVLLPPADLPKSTQMDPSSFLGILGSISAFLYALIKIARSLSIWATPEHGTTIRIFLLGAGAVAGLLGYFASGLPWYQAIYLFIAGPGAIVINEMTKIDWTKVTGASAVWIRIKSIFSRPSQS